jgi:hypothetical protein
MQAVSIKALYNDPATSDITVGTVLGRQIYAHVAILREASPYFTRVLEARPKILIIDPRHREVLPRVIKWIYGFDMDHTQTTLKKWIGTQQLAKQLGLQDLVKSLDDNCPETATPAELICAGHEYDNPGLVILGIRRLLRKQTVPPELLCQITELGFAAHAYMRIIWLEHGFTTFNLFLLDCNAVEKLAPDTHHAVLSSMMESIDFRTFASFQRDLAATFPVMRDWNFGRYVIKMAGPRQQYNY